MFRTCDVRHVAILFLFYFINSARFRKKWRCFLFLCRCFRLVILFSSLCFCFVLFFLLVRFFSPTLDFPTIKHRKSRWRELCKILYFKTRNTFNFSPCARYCLLIGWKLITWSHGNLHYIRLRVMNYGLHLFKLHGEFFCLLQTSLVRLYSAAATPSERLRSDGSLAMTSYLVTIETDHHRTCFKIHARNKQTPTENVRCWSFFL